MKKIDAVMPSPDERQAPVFRRQSVSGPAPVHRDQSDESATFHDRVHMLFDAKVPGGGAFSRTLEFDVAGVTGKITETGPGHLYVDFPQRGLGMLIANGLCTPTTGASARDLHAMQKATLLGLGG